MTTITIPQTQAKKRDLVAIPREEYEEFLSWKKIMPIFKPSKAELRTLARGEREIASGRFKPWNEVKNELANLNRRRPAKAA